MGCLDALRFLVRSPCAHAPPWKQERRPATVFGSTESISTCKETRIVVKAMDPLEDEVLNRTTKGQERYLTSPESVVKYDGELSCSLNPVVEELRNLIEKDSSIHRLFTDMFGEIPRQPAFALDPNGQPQIRDYKTLLGRLNDVIIRAPEFQTTIMKGFPINALLAFPMATPSGIVAFLNEKVNVQIKKILETWAIFLRSPESRYVLDADSDKSWLGSKALALMPNFAVDFVCSPAEPYFGFQSWDDFFTRRLREGARLVDSPDDSAVIVNACESAPYRLAYGVRAHDQFWMKDQAYSLADMLAADALSPSFYGGTVYQAYLGPTNYHRWHSPVSGTIRKAYGKPGAYYAQSPSVGFDRSTPNGSQAYLTHVATRAMIFIEAEDAKIGLMCFMPVGITECSSCEVTVSEGQRVEKGDEIGMFHYGGSTYCLIFRPESTVRFRPEATKSGAESRVLQVNSMLAKVQ
ncbi:MAG: hypothetical protein L6R36_001807 [Xanthoria steineri]|nr:MAG: hypothetical protein L6R36_001807 [Xanthoria steineri]